MRNMLLPSRMSRQQLIDIVRRYHKPRSEVYEMSLPTLRRFAKQYLQQAFVDLMIKGNTAILNQEVLDGPTTT